MQGWEVNIFWPKQGDIIFTYDIPTVPCRGGKTFFFNPDPKHTSEQMRGRGEFVTQLYSMVGAFKLLEGDKTK